MSVVVLHPPVAHSTSSANASNPLEAFLDSQAPNTPHVLFKKTCKLTQAVAARGRLIAGRVASAVGRAGLLTRDAFAAGR